MRTLIKHGLIVDPASHVHSQNNLLVEDGRIQGLTAEEPEADVILDAEGMVVSPGFVDIHMHEDPYDPGGATDSQHYDLHASHGSHYSDWWKLRYQYGLASAVFRIDGP